MKNIISRYAAYNLWANEQLMQTVLKLSDEENKKKIDSSFPGILPTILHLWNAESIWWQRIKLQEPVKAPADHFEGSVREAVMHLLSQSGEWVAWTQQASEASLDHVFEYRNSKKEVYKQPVYEALLHVFNHQSYHRGQIVTMLRQLGVKEIPGTDLINFTRLRKSVVVNNRVLNSI